MNSSITKHATVDLKKSYAAAVDWLANFVIDGKRRYPRRLYVVGIQGSVGRGKSTFSLRVAEALNKRLNADDGCAVSRSLDDYYLPRFVRMRPSFRMRGYNPRGISNRGPAGTHDLPLLFKNLKAMESSSKQTRMELPVFDKQEDDRALKPDVVRGRVGVFILEGWFVGAGAPSSIDASISGLPYAVSRALRKYQPIFRRLDALWVFKAPTFASIIAERIEQQNTLNRETGRPGMTPSLIRRFVHYFYKEGWIPGVTSPVPPSSRITFWAEMDAKRRWIHIQKSLKSGDG